jgi:hypothetical protein
MPGPQYPPLTLSTVQCHRIQNTSIEQALLKIDAGSSIRAAAAEMGVSYTTLHRHYETRLHAVSLPDAGRVPSIPFDTQAEIAEVARAASTRGSGLLRHELQNFIGRFVETN